MRPGARWMRGALFFASPSGALLAFSSCMTGAPSGPPVAWVNRAAVPEGLASLRSREASWRLLTLNVAHGRGDGRNQALRKGRTIRSNLDRVAEVLKRERPDLAALQEADGPSIWSGRFDHVRRLAEEAGYPWTVRGEHARGPRIAYGSALLSMRPLEDPYSVTFRPSPPTSSKGFVVGSIGTPGVFPEGIDVASVHLDFSRKAVRRRQVREMIETLAPRGRPLVVMGDMNCEWGGKDRTIRDLAAGLSLRPYRPGAEGLATFDHFPSAGKRLDWILISKDLEFRSYRVLPDVLSDHQAVVAEIAPAGGATGRGAGSGPPSGR